MVFFFFVTCYWNLEQCFMMIKSKEYQPVVWSWRILVGSMKRYFLLKSLGLFLSLLPSLLREIPRTISDTRRSKPAELMWFWRCLKLFVYNVLSLVLDVFACILWCVCATWGSLVPQQLAPVAITVKIDCPGFSFHRGHAVLSLHLAYFYRAVCLAMI